jgi:hypothetical protein
MTNSASVFVGQTLLTFNIYTGYTGTPDTQKILVEKPNGERVEWTGRYLNGTISYDVTDTDINISGEWKLQSWISAGGKIAMGEITTIEVGNSLK